MNRKAAATLFIVSFLSLFFEMFFIRYASSLIPVMGYYTNLVLIACFLGLGAGCLLAGHRARLIHFFPSLFTALLLIIAKFRHVGVEGPSREMIYLDSMAPTVTISLYSCLALFYLLIAITFIPFGQEIGKLMREMAPLVAYSVNIGGSIAGILIFALFSLFCLSPFYWLLFSLPFLLYLFLDRKPLLVLNCLLLILSLGSIFYSTRGTFWSPYHKITTKPLRYGTDSTNRAPVLHRYFPLASDRTLPESLGFDVLVNEKTYQTPLDLSEKAIKDYPFLKNWQLTYDFPYLYANKKDVLVVGGGTGNDAAAALRNGAEKIDVVDIEPVLIELGRNRHPEKPYLDPRVTVYTDDARSYFHKTEKKYDLVVFGYLDSHSIISSMSNARLDSYVYTIESFTEARKLLKNDGMMVVSFASANRYIAERLCLMLRVATGSEPVFFMQGAAGINLLAGDRLNAFFPGRQEHELSQTTRMTTDDWPFFYLESNFISREYLITLSLIIIISALIVFLCNRSSRKGLDSHFFLLGCAFMLLETKSITSLALLFGSTWFINSLVISFILIMILLANAFVARFGPGRKEHYYVLLGVTILLNFLIPLKAIHFDNLIARIIISGILISSPMFFAGILFANSFRESKSPDFSLGSNILGGVLGGVLEYQSLVTGFNFLLVMVFLIYLLSYLVTRIPGREGEPGGAASDA